MSNLIEGGVLKHALRQYKYAQNLSDWLQSQKLVQSRVVIWVSEKAEMFKLFHAAYVTWFITI